MKELTVQVVNKRGLHARAAARFVHIASTFESAITVVHEAEEADGKSILSLMVLGAAPGTSVLIRAEGPDEEAALGRLAEFIGCGCEED